MLNFSTKQVSNVLVMVVTGGAVLAYSALQPNTEPNVPTLHVTAVTEAVKVENISQEYARAHRELMKQADEAPVKSF